MFEVTNLEIFRSLQLPDSVRLLRSTLCVYDCSFSRKKMYNYVCYYSDLTVNEWFILGSNSNW